jgi:hypothetical protein
MKVPNADRALVDIRKLKEYCLNTQHRIGKNKAKVFATALGLTADDAEELLSILLKVIEVSDAEIGLKDRYGQRYLIDFPLEWRGGKATVRSSWIIEPDMSYPRLTSCYVLE